MVFILCWSLNAVLLYGILSWIFIRHSDKRLKEHFVHGPPSTMTLFVQTLLVKSLCYQLCHIVCGTLQSSVDCQSCIKLLNCLLLSSDFQFLSSEFQTSLNDLVDLLSARVIQQEEKLVAEQDKYERLQVELETLQDKWQRAESLCKGTC